MTKHSAELQRLWLLWLRFLFFWRNVFSHIGTQALRTVKHCRSLPLSLSNEANWRKFQARRNWECQGSIWAPPISGFHKSKIFFLKWPPFSMLHPSKFLELPAGLKVRIRRICLEVHKFENREHFLTWWLFPVMK
jgi:hypothetical protein